MSKLYPNLHQDLINRCKQGDVRAQFELYKLYYKAMYNTCLRIVRDQQEAEDVMQESFLAAFKNLPFYKGKVSFGAWLKRIVVNRSIDFLKKKKIDLALNDSIENIHATDLDEGKVNLEETNRQVGLIKKAMGILPHGYRIILSLHLLEGYDHEEIAVILGVSASTSRSQYSRAKKKLLEILKNQKR